MSYYDDDKKDPPCPHGFGDDVVCLQCRPELREPAALPGFQNGEGMDAGAWLPVEDEEGYALVECDECGARTLDDNTDVCRNPACRSNDIIREAIAMLEADEDGAESDNDEGTAAQAHRTASRDGERNPYDPMAGKAENALARLWDDAHRGEAQAPSLPDEREERYTALIEAFADAIREDEWATQRHDDDLSAHRGDETARAKAALLAALRSSEAALSEARRDTERLDAMERQGFRAQPDGMDGWFVRVPGTLGGMRQGYARHGAHRLREALDAAARSLPEKPEPATPTTGHEK
jgi:hypothetical protein